MDGLIFKQGTGFAAGSGIDWRPTESEAEWLVRAGFERTPMIRLGDDGVETRFVVHRREKDVRHRAKDFRYVAFLYDHGARTSVNLVTGDVDLMALRAAVAPLVVASVITGLVGG